MFVTADGGYLLTLGGGYLTGPGARDATATRKPKKIGVFHFNK